MHTIDLAYVGRGIHEELIAYVADQEGYFEDEGVHVALRDGTRWKTERLRTGATIGLGRALLSRLTDGIQWNVLTVNTQRLEGTAALSYSRSRLRLWRGLHSAYQGDGHSRPTDLSALAMAERVRGEAHRLDPAGLP